MTLKYQWVINNKKYNYTYYLEQLINEKVEINSELVYNCIYNYDAFGNILNLNDLSSIAEINPFKYKGYYCDSWNLFWMK